VKRAVPSLQGAFRHSAASHTMRRPIVKKAEAEILTEHPIAGFLPGWYVRMRETSNQVWLAEGRGLRGRQVSCRVAEGEIQPCVAMAEKIQRALDGAAAADRRLEPVSRVRYPVGGRSRLSSSR
jgi:hypothetical protein